MGVGNSQLQPYELVAFKKLPTNVQLNAIQIPEAPENRKPTNVKWLIFLGIVILVLIPFMAYTIYYSDTRRFIGRYDQCGNICGSQNFNYSDIPCSGKNMINYPYLQYERTTHEDKLRPKKCVAECYEPFMGICSPVRSNNEILIDDRYDINIETYFNGVKWQIIISCLFSILVSMGMLFLFRYAVACVVWSILVGSFFALVLLCVGCWYAYSQAPTESKQSFMVASIIFTVVVIFLGIVLVWCRNKIKLVILLLKETSKAVFDMPQLIFIPVLSCFVILILSILCLVTSVFMASAGDLKQVAPNYYDYKLNPVMIFSLAYNGVMFIWLSQFFTGIQYMIVAGAVAKWYFTRDKSFLGSPILTSTYNVFKFHLGTVALGSWIITLVSVIKNIILGLIQNDKVRLIMGRIIESIESLFKFLSKNAYIVSALHGQAFIKSGKRAAKLLLQNLGDVIAINYISDFVLGMAKLLIVVVSILISVLIFYIAPGNNPHMSNFWGYLVIFIISLVAACITFGVFETTIDTLFICYCEDTLINDGVTKAFYMSRNLMEFIEDSKKIYKKQ